MNKPRLLKLARLLEADAKNKKGIRFDLNYWGIAEDPKAPTSCGTTACAMGLAVASGVFVQDGLLPPVKLLCSHLDLTPRMKGGKKDVWAAAKLFDISVRDAQWLFFEREYPGLPTRGAKGERAVANRIREFVAGKAGPELP